MSRIIVRSETFQTTLVKLTVVRNTNFAITVCLPPSVRYADFALYAGKAYADFA